MYKNSLTFIVIVILSFIVVMSCGKTSDSSSVSCTDVPPSADSSALLNFAKNKGITPVKDTTGLYYQILTQGTGAAPTDNSTIFVTYTGIRMNGTIFDSTTNSAKTGWQLRTLIPGWRIGLPKIQAGGHIKLLIPSTYGYGCQGIANIVDSNSPLYFDITLVSVQ